MTIDDKWFRRVDENFLAMRQMISTFRSLGKTKQRLENQLKAASPAFRDGSRMVLELIEEEKEAIARRITEEAERRLPYFKTIVEELGISGDNHILARELWRSR